MGTEGQGGQKCSKLFYLLVFWEATDKVENQQLSTRLLDEVLLSLPVKCKTIFLANHLQCCIVDTPLFVKMHILRLISSVWDFWARSSGCCLTIMLYSQLLHSSLFGLNLPTNTHGDGESPCQKRLQIYNTLSKYALQLHRWHLLDQIRHQKTWKGQGSCYYL